LAIHPTSSKQSWDFLQHHHKEGGCRNQLFKAQTEAFTDIIKIRNSGKEAERRLLYPSEDISA
jgi:hypothetical protein